MQNMKLGLIFTVLCVVLTFEAASAEDSSITIPKNADPKLVNDEVAANAKVVADAAADEPSAQKKLESADSKVAVKSDDVEVEAQKNDAVNDVNSHVDGEVVTPIDVAMIQKQIELLKQPGMRRLARQLNRFHQGQLFEATKRRPIWSEDEEDDAVAEERAIRRRTRIRRRNSSNNVKRNRRKNQANRKNSSRRKQNNRNSFKRKNVKSMKNQINKKGLRNGNKKGAKGVKKTKRTNQGQRNSNRRMSNRRKNNQKNKNRRQNIARYEDGEDDDLAA